MLLITSGASYAQKLKDVDILVECVEYIGNDTWVANFGYNNPNNKDVSVPETNSTLIFNNGQSAKALNLFKPGRQTNVFKSEFTSQGSVLWHVILPTGVIKDVIASINSIHCSGTGNGNIFPYYTPPPNGKDATVIGPELTSLYNTFIATGTAESNIIFQINNNKVLIDIKIKSGFYSTLLNLVTANYGFELLFGDPANNLITGWIPIRNLILLNNNGNYIELVRPVIPSVLNNTGHALNLGDFSMRSDFVRNGYGLTGKGVKIGVLSDSYNAKSAAGTDIQNGDLPGPGNIDGNLQEIQVKDYPYSFISTSDEGRGMLQIIHDIAPGANLAFRTGYVSPGDMAAGIIELADAGCNILVDDITYITEPFFTDGKISKAVDNVVSRGVTYFSAAGNFGRNSYSAVFSPQKVQAPNGLSGSFHNFGNGDTYQNISLADGSYVIVMQWVDSPNAKNDFDIYLANDNGTTLFGFNRNNIGTEPIEILPFIVQGGGANTNILINRASGTENPIIKYVVFRGEIVINEFNTGNSTIVGQANSAGAITVGAVKYDNTPYYGVDPPTIAIFPPSGVQ